MAIANQQSPALISGSQALGIAEADALRAYGDLSSYQVRVRLEPDGWHVDYELSDPDLQGGGAHYVLDPGSGAIVLKRYEQ